jgi:hypothetical protein
MDFRMDKSSWGILVFMFAASMFFILQGARVGMPTTGYFQAIGFSLVASIVLVAIMCIPVVVYCYTFKMIPDIDYSIRVAFAVTIVGIISIYILISAKTKTMAYGRYYGGLAIQTVDKAEEVGPVGLN